MLSVPGRASSPAFVGREAELDALTGTLADLDGDDRRVIVVSGEAGIGKTRLLDEFSRSLAGRTDGGRTARVLRGACVELAGGELPFAPILDVLADLSVGSSPEVGIEARRLRDAIAGTEPAAEGIQNRGRLFVELRDLLAAGAADGDLVVVIDDLHWADRSTLDLLTFLGPRVRGASVILLLTYRDDEIHRRHPLRPFLAEIERGGIRSTIHLAPLDARSMEEQAEAILGAGADPRLVRRVVDVADGNPFHAEELLALGADATVLPRSLRDVLLARLDRLDPNTLDLLGTAAVIGRDVNEGLLLAVTDGSAADVRAGLREAIDRFVLEVAPGTSGYRFRHALLREAVLDDLLPSTPDRDAPQGRSGRGRRLLARRLDTGARRC